MIENTQQYTIKQSNLVDVGVLTRTIIKIIIMPASRESTLRNDPSTRVQNNSNNETSLSILCYQYTLMILIVNCLCRNMFRSINPIRTRLFLIWPMYFLGSYHKKTRNFKTNTAGILLIHASNSVYAFVLTALRLDDIKNLLGMKSRLGKHSKPS